MFIRVEKVFNKCKPENLISDPITFSEALPSDGFRSRIFLSSGDHLG